MIVQPTTCGRCLRDPFRLIAYDARVKSLTRSDPQHCDHSSFRRNNRRPCVPHRGDGGQQPLARPTPSSAGHADRDDALLWDDTGRSVSATHGLADACPPPPNLTTHPELTLAFGPSRGHVGLSVAGRGRDRESPLQFGGRGSEVGVRCSKFFVRDSMFTVAAQDSADESLIVSHEPVIPNEKQNSDLRPPTPERYQTAIMFCSQPRGPVAQLGARLNGIQEVTSSILVRSTNLRS